ncbi:MAG: hypothetical protein AB1657_05205 [Candidatus Micrarchaeota archaeon]
MDDAKEDDGRLAIAAMELDGQMENGRWLPIADMRVVAAHHPEEETRRLVGKAMVVRLVHGSEPADRRIESLREMTTGEKYHREAREDACTVLRRVLSEQGNWDELALMALDNRLPKRGREDLASAYLSCPAVEEGMALEILRCVDLNEEFRQNEGMRLVDRAPKESGIARKIADGEGMPAMLRVYAKSALGKGSGDFSEERKHGPPNMGLFGMFSTNGKK